jgi:hypothetical protein
MQRGWTDSEDGLTSLTLESSVADIPFEELAGALTSQKENRLSIPLLFDYSDSSRRTSYRIGDAIGSLPNGRPPCGTSWIEIDPRMSLKRAFELYGEDLLAFEKIVRRISLEIVVLVRQRREQILRVLVRRPTPTT